MNARVREMASRARAAARDRGLDIGAAWNLLDECADLLEDVNRTAVKRNRVIRRLRRRCDRRLQAHAKPTRTQKQRAAEQCRWSLLTSRQDGGECTISVMIKPEYGRAIYAYVTWMNVHGVAGLVEALRELAGLVEQQAMAGNRGAS